MLIRIDPRFNSRENGRRPRWSGAMNSIINEILHAYTSIIFYIDNRFPHVNYAGFWTNSISVLIRVINRTADRGRDGYSGKMEVIFLLFGISYSSLGSEIPTTNDNRKATHSTSYVKFTCVVFKSI